MSETQQFIDMRIARVKQMLTPQELAVYNKLMSAQNLSPSCAYLCLVGVLAGLTPERVQAGMKYAKTLLQ